MGANELLERLREVPRGFMTLSSFLFRGPAVLVYVLCYGNRDREAPAVRVTRPVSKLYSS